jgi:23S rRNA (pseudouridine1915-N3)-methyltransferase
VRLVVVAVGRVKDRALRAVLDDYLARLRRMVVCEEVEVAVGPAGKVAAQIERATAGATVIALEVGGRAWTSAEFARELERCASRDKGVVAFLVGGADGLPADVVGRAHLRWSLSTLTFPHRLARLVLVEQLYRAMTILRGEPYAH